jgi:hypothetical protein
MKTTTKLLALGAVGAAAGAVAYGAVRLLRRRQAAGDVDREFDTSDVSTDPVVVTEEVVVITEAGPYEVDLELIPADELANRGY